MDRIRNTLVNHDFRQGAGERFGKVTGLPRECGRTPIDAQPDSEDEN
jgi:hypothetical protein